MLRSWLGALKRAASGHGVAVSPAIKYPDPGTFEWYRDLQAANRLVVLDFATKPELRRPERQAIHPRIYQAIDAGRAGYAAILRGFLDFQENFAQIPATLSDTEPGWTNEWIPALDAISLYGFVAQRKPRRYVEIGSGVSTQFVRKAIQDHNLDTRIVSIDPHPRLTIDAICDETIRLPLEKLDRSFFAGLDKDDILFCDNSHRSFQNSDVTVYMTEILPELIGKGVLTGVHDIFLPYDYPAGWLERFYNEQYLLIGYLLGGCVSITLPCLFCCSEIALSDELAPIWQLPNLGPGSRNGGIMWMTT